MEDQPLGATPSEKQTEEAPTPVARELSGEAEPPKTEANPNEGVHPPQTSKAMGGEPTVKPVEGQKPSTEKKLDKHIDVSPISSGEDLSENEVSNIIKQTQDILQFCQKKVDEQKIISHSLAFMLIRIKESIDSYCKDYIPFLNTFLVNADLITGKYYAQMCCNLPMFGDYEKAIDAAEGDVLEAGGDQPVSKSRLSRLVENVTDNYYASAMFVKSVRSVLRDVNKILMADRRDVTSTIYTPYPDWMGIQDNVNCQLDGIRDQIFKISTYIDFLNHDASKEGPKLDLSHLEKNNKNNKDKDGKNKKNDKANENKKNDKANENKKNEESNKTKKGKANKENKDDANKSKKNDESHEGETTENDGISIHLPDIRVPDVKIHDVNLPDAAKDLGIKISIPDVKIPDVSNSIISIKMPEIKMPHIG